MPARGYLSLVRRLMPFLVLLALLVAPFGRQAAQAAVYPGAMSAMAGHCDPAPRPAPAQGGSIDCMIACAATPAVDAMDVPVLLPLPPAAPVAGMIAPIAGLHPAAEPPPPR